jgi:hypothetical protein
MKMLPCVLSSVMNFGRLFFAGAALLVLQTASHARITVLTEHNPTGVDFSFTSIPRPVSNDAASDAQFTLVDGQRDTNGGGLAVLHDGQLPTEEDQPSANFFFRAGTESI